MEVWPNLRPNRQKQKFIHRLKDSQENSNKHENWLSKNTLKTLPTLERHYVLIVWWEKDTTITELKGKGQRGHDLVSKRQEEEDMGFALSSSSDARMIRSRRSFGEIEGAAAALVGVGVFFFC